MFSKRKTEKEKKKKKDTQCTTSASRGKLDRSLPLRPYLRAKGAEQLAHGPETQRREGAGLGEAEA